MEVFIGSVVTAIGITVSLCVWLVRRYKRNLQILRDSRHALMFATKDTELAADLHDYPDISWVTKCRRLAQQGHNPKLKELQDVADNVQALRMFKEAQAYLDRHLQDVRTDVRVARIALPEGTV